MVKIKKNTQKKYSKVELLAYKFYLEAKTQGLSVGELYQVTHIMLNHSYNSTMGVKKIDSKQ